LFSNLHFFFANLLLILPPQILEHKDFRGKNTLPVSFSENVAVSSKMVTHFSIKKVFLSSKNRWKFVIFRKKICCHIKFAKKKWRFENKAKK
jgi:hypothetical protein